jgi:hypothetical protein
MGLSGEAVLLLDVSMEIPRCLEVTARRCPLWLYEAETALMARPAI